MKDWVHLQDIEGSLSDNLHGRLVGLAVCGSIAAIEIHRVARLLMRHGARVQVFMTEAAAGLVSPTALSWCTGRPVILSLTARCEHLEFFGERGSADLLLVAPATANTIGKVALGLDDNVVTTCVTTALGTGIPVLCAPGMHEPMMENPAVRSNLRLLEEYGVELLRPTPSEGKQKMMAAQEMVARVLRKLGPGDLRGRSVLLTGGPTREFIDPARCLTNPSSGLSACLLASEAFRRGGEVTLVYGPGSAEPDPWLDVRRVSSTSDMESAVRQAIAAHPPDLVVGVAAVADFRPAVSEPSKRPTAEGGFSLQLEPTAKVIDAARELAPKAFLVAFKAASVTGDEQLSEAAQPYLESGRADLVVANSVLEPGLGFEAPDNRYVLVSKDARPCILGPASKQRLSRLLWDRIVELSGS